MSDKKVVVTGASGRMGRRLVALTDAEDGLVLSGAVEAPGHPDLGVDAGLLAGTRELGVKITDDLSDLLDDADVLIDFTAPKVSVESAGLCAEKNTAVVIGTTGMTEDENAKVRSYKDKVAIVLAPNMSVGMNVLFHLVKESAKILGRDFDIEIVEAHHNMKKDAPSGSAVHLAKVAAKGRNFSYPDCARHCRDGIIGERPKDEIGVQTVRGGDIVGDHTVLFAGTGERIELVHRAHSRDTFAKGAVRTALWLTGKGPGVYNMSDVLGLPEI